VGRTISIGLFIDEEIVQVNWVVARHIGGLESAQVGVGLAGLHKTVSHPSQIASTTSRNNKRITSLELTCDWIKKINQI
jgi:hypothetical protein